MRRSLPSHLLMLLTALLFIGCTTTTLSILKRGAITQTSVRIMPLGDSITYGIGSIAKGGYRVMLWRECVAANLPITFVGSRNSGPADLPDQANEGHPGWRIDQISSHVVAWLHTYQPQIILLHIGTNDIIQNYRLNNAPARLQYLLMQITTTLPTATVIVAQLIPSGNPRRNNAVITYNRALPAIIHKMATQGKHVEYVDMYNALSASNLPDTIHPSNQGYSLMADVWFAVLKPLLLVRRTG